MGTGTADQLTVCIGPSRRGKDATQLARPELVRDRVPPMIRRRTYFIKVSATNLDVVM